MADRYSQPVTVTLPPKLYRLAERIASEEGRTRSEVFREALRLYIWQRKCQRVSKLGAAKAKKLGLREEDIERLVDEDRA